MNIVYLLVADGRCLYIYMVLALMTFIDISANSFYEICQKSVFSALDRDERNSWELHEMGNVLLKVQLYNEKCSI